MTETPDLTLGATRMGEGRCRFRVWAPDARTVQLDLVEPRQRVVPMEPQPAGYYEVTLDDVEPGALYFYRLDGDRLRPDPASRFQPRGVHGPSGVVDTSFPWEDGGWRGFALSDLVFYELHVGTFAPEGTFDAVVPHLPGLRELGITAVEVMPVAQFPGARNWGYDGVDLFAVQDSYGGPDGLRRLVQACHGAGLALFLDVVYNHLGSEGNYLGEFGPYFSEVYRTPWGPAPNFDGPGSDDVRRFFLENALSWFREFHVDGLRLDALHAILDRTARPFLEDLCGATRLEAERSGRRLHLIGESNANDARLVEPPERGGAAWMPSGATTSTTRSTWR